MKSFLKEGGITKYFKDYKIHLAKLSSHLLTHFHQMIADTKATRKLSLPLVYVYTCYFETKGQ